MGVSPPAEGSDDRFPCPAKLGELGFARRKTDAGDADS
jgi:hypothetical protein